MTTATALIIMDYQNIHLTGRDVFAPVDLPTHECLVHPGLFAEQVLKARHRRTGVNLDLVGVKVFRGAPSQKENARAYGYSQANKSEWTRNRLVSVEYRTLRYFWDGNERRSQEKGIDVRVALTLAEAAMTKAADVVILASHDTDLEPALDAAQEWGAGTTVETVGWDGCRILRPKNKTFHTRLDAAAFVASRDRKDYDKK